MPLTAEWKIVVGWFILEISSPSLVWKYLEKLEFWKNIGLSASQMCYCTSVVHPHIAALWSKSIVGCDADLLILLVG